MMHNKGSIQTIAAILVIVAIFIYFGISPGDIVSWVVNFIRSIYYAVLGFVGQ